jgi:hypothetical protein
MAGSLSDNGHDGAKPTRAADVTVWTLWSADACAPERVDDCCHLYVRPYATARRADIALVELRGNGVVAGRAGPHDLIDDRSHIGSKPPRFTAAVPRLAALARLSRRCPSSATLNVRDMEAG